MSNIISLLNFLKQFLAELMRCTRSTVADTDFFICTVRPSVGLFPPLLISSHTSCVYLAFKSTLLPLAKRNVSFTLFNAFLFTKLQISVNSWTCGFKFQVQLKFANMMEWNEENNRRKDSLRAFVFAALNGCQLALVIFGHLTRKTVHSVCLSQLSVFRSLTVCEGHLYSLYPHLS